MEKRGTTQAKLVLGAVSAAAAFGAFGPLQSQGEVPGEGDCNQTEVWCGENLRCLEWETDPDPKKWKCIRDTTYTVYMFKK